MRPSALMQVNFYSLINALGSMNVGLMQIRTPLSPSSSHNKNQIHVQNHARVHIDCERVCDQWAFPSIFSSTLILIPTQLNLALFPPQENAHTRVCDMENFYAMHMYHLFNHWIRVWWNHITNVISEGSGEPALLCNLVRVTLLTNSKFLSGWRLRHKQSRHLRTPTKKLCFKFYILSSPKRARNKRYKIHVSLNWQASSWNCIMGQKDWTD